jgi:flagellar L-ring protein precursor FlgH
MSDTRTFIWKCRRGIVWGGLALLLGAPAPLWAENIWQRRTPDRGFLFYDTKARNIGDNLTVVISQTTDVNNKENRNMEKATSSKATLNWAGSTDGGLGAQEAKAAAELDTSSDRKFDGQAAYTTAQAFTDRMTVTVMDVLPNGNMIVSGERRVRVAGEERTLVMSGVIRGLDIGPDNTINSQYVSQFRLDYQPGGPAQKFTRQGWLGRATNVVWPF